MNNTKRPKLTVPLGRDAHAIACQFATQQATAQKGKRVYLNTLAVYAVHSYLKWLKIETDLSTSDSWHRGMQAVFNIADLAIPEIGYLECRPILPGETACYLPPEVTENRIGYIGVQFNENLEEVELLGFAPSVDPLLPPEHLQIADFKPIDNLIDHICRLKNARETTVNLSQWFENIFETGWQTVEALLGSEKASLAFSFRSIDPIRETVNQAAEIKRGKLIDLGIQLLGNPVALVVALMPASKQETDILVQVHPTGENSYLPAQLQLLVLDHEGTTVLEAQARNADNYIQLQFSGLPGETFSVKVAFGEENIIQSFAI
ncbi:MAG: DUF1822 family protein [Microcoleus vaginatus WJT46-NPBG5]|jgi:hypothetical protein|nr:DUF1822 family protein [Microcoleus vaginatus WJT46-NPBG5]